MLGGGGGRVEGWVLQKRQSLDFRFLEVGFSRKINNTHSALREVIAMLKTVAENINAFYKGSENSSQS